MLICRWFVVYGFIYATATPQHSATSKLETHQPSAGNQKKFTAFLQHVIVVLSMYNDTDLKLFFNILRDVVENYQQSGSKFNDLTKNHCLGTSLAISKLIEINNRPANNIRKVMLAVANKIEEEKYDEKEREIVDLTNLLYNHGFVDKFQDLLINIDDFRLNAVKSEQLLRKVKRGIGSILFDYYTELEDKTRAVLNTNIDKYWNCRPNFNSTEEPYNKNNNRSKKLHATNNKTSGKLNTSKGLNVQVTKELKTVHQINEKDSLNLEYDTSIPSNKNNASSTETELAEEDDTIPNEINLYSNKTYDKFNHTLIQHDIYQTEATKESRSLIHSREERSIEESSIEASNMFKKLTFLTLYPEFDTDAPTHFRVTNRMDTQTVPGNKRQTPRHKSVAHMKTDMNSKSQMMRSKSNAFIEVMTIRAYVPQRIRKYKKSKHKHTTNTNIKSKQTTVRMTASIYTSGQYNATYIKKKLKSLVPPYSPVRHVSTLFTDASNNEKSSRRYSIRPKRKRRRIKRPINTKFKHKAFVKNSNNESENIIANDKNVLFRIKELEDELKVARRRIKEFTKIIKRMKGGGNNNYDLKKLRRHKYFIRNASNDRSKTVDGTVYKSMIRNKTYNLDKDEKEEISTSPPKYERNRKITTENKEINAIVTLRHNGVRKMRKWNRHGRYKRKKNIKTKTQIYDIDKIPPTNTIENVNLDASKEKEDKLHHSDVNTDKLKKKTRKNNYESVQEIKNNFTLGTSKQVMDLRESRTSKIYYTDMHKKSSNDGRRYGSHSSLQDGKYDVNLSNNKINHSDLNNDKKQAEIFNWDIKTKGENVTNVSKSDQETTLNINTDDIIRNFENISRTEKFHEDKEITSKIKTLNENRSRKELEGQFNNENVDNSAEALLLANQLIRNIEVSKSNKDIKDTFNLIQQKHLEDLKEDAKEEIITGIPHNVANYDIDIEDDWEKINAAAMFSELDVKANTSPATLRPARRMERTSVATTRKYTTQTTTAVALTPSTLFPISEPYFNEVKTDDPLSPVYIDLRNPFDPNRLLFEPNASYNDNVQRIGYPSLVPPAGEQRFVVDSSEILRREISKGLDLGNHYAQTTPNYNEFANDMVTLSDKRKMVHDEINQHMNSLISGRRNMNVNKTVDEASVSDDILSDPILKDIDAALEF